MALLVYDRDKAPPRLPRAEAAQDQKALTPFNLGRYLARTRQYYQGPDDALGQVRPPMITCDRLRNGWHTQSQKREDSDSEVVHG